MAKVENNETTEKNGWQKFWESRVAMPVVFITGAVATVVGGVIGAVAGSVWAKSAAAEREAAPAEPETVEVAEEAKATEAEPAK